ncbi:MAG: response regulator [Candidatus Sericytochromatia bacterium]|nr:response regulator [Candidatus Sericytochromatia bacterium]
MKPDLMVIDDDEIIWVLIKDMLQDLDLVGRLSTFSDGDAALNHLKSLNTAAPPLIVLDLNLPFMNGFEFLAAYAESLYPRFPETRVHILTSSVRDSDRQQTLKYPFVKSFLTKPLKIEQLKAILNQHPPGA